MAMKIMSLTEAAAARIREIMAEADAPVIGVRIGIKNAGCAGMAYTLDYVSEPPEGDDHVNEHGVDVYVEPKATLFLLGTVMDFKTDKLSSGFTFTNPNQTGACGCGESVQLAPADLKALAEARAAAAEAE
jgi:iron-sulfur cluster assembly protein